MVGVRFSGIALSVTTPKTDDSEIFRIWELSNSGDKSSFDYLVLESIPYANKAVLRARSRCRVIPKDEMYLIAYAYLLKAIKSFDPTRGSIGEHVTTCVYQAIRREAIRLQCIRYGGKASHVEDANDELKWAESRSESPESVAERSEQSESVREIVSRGVGSGSKEWIALSMRYGLCGKNEMLTHEIAKHLGMSRSMIRDWIRNAKDKLREELHVA